MKEELVSEKFQVDQLMDCQRRSWALLNDLAEKMKPGMSEADGVALYNELAVQHGAEKYWHPPKIRFGQNTLCAFSDKSIPDVVLKKDDILFMDIGPIFNGYEGDVGRTFTMGDYSAGKRVIQDCEKIYHQVEEKFKNENVSGVELYEFAQGLASEMGYDLVDNGARGHRIADFPHAIYHRGDLKSLDRKPLSNRWILEIQIRKPDLKIGAFFEDILGK